MEAINHSEGRAKRTGSTWTYEYVIKDHLGNTRVLFTDTNNDGAPEMKEEYHYYPFGMRMDGWPAGTGNYRYQYNGKEVNTDFGLHWVDYGARMYDAGIGRFTGVDPISDEFPWVSTYNYAENEPIANIDLWGLQKLSIHSASFAPFNKFGGPFKGDGDNRKFSTNPNESSRISGQINLNATSEGIAMDGRPEAQGAVSHSTVLGISTYSDATITAELTPREGNESMAAGADLSFHLSGNNDLVPLSPDIDTKGDIGIGRTETESGGSIVLISGSISGDKFPANETYVTDQSGTGVFLGVSGADGNPYTSLPGDNNRTMSRFTVGIVFDNKGNISGVTVGGTAYSVSDWNAQFEKLNPQDGNVSTNRY